MRRRGASNSPSRASLVDKSDVQPAPYSPLFRVLVCLPVLCLLPALVGIAAMTQRLARSHASGDDCPNLATMHPGITKVDLRNCNLKHVPLVAFEFASVSVVDLSRNAVSHIPPAFCEQLPNVEIVFLSENAFTSVPDMSRCAKLRILSLKRNQITSFSETALPTDIQWLMLTANDLDRLPHSFGRHHKLQKLMLTGNRLAALPDSFSNLVSLELVRLASNKLERIPDFVFKLPRLSWISLSGNPMGPPRDLASHALRVEQWHKVVKGELLGEGTSGEVFRGYLRAEKNVPLAFKVFKSDMTNDGAAVDEVDTALAASAAKAGNLVTPVAQIVGHPAGSQVLAYALLDSHTALGDPPSLTTCTRDLFYAPKFAGASEVVLFKIILDLASALTALHAQGILHGDFYAHNVLCKGIYTCKVSDFGAASRMHASWAEAAQRVEARAFGALIDDLLPFFPDAGSALVAKLTRVRNATFSERDASKRPLMAAVVNTLRSM